MLVHNEDEFVEQALRNAAPFCDRFHVADNMSTDGTWDAVRHVASEIGHVEPVRVRRTGDSHALVEGYAGTDTWVFGSTATSSTTPLGWRPSASSYSTAPTANGSASSPTSSTSRSWTGSARRAGTSRRLRARSRSSSTSPPSTRGLSATAKQTARRRDRFPGGGTTESRWRPQRALHVGREPVAPPPRVLSAPVEPRST